MIKVKEYFDVKIEVLAPTTLIYRIQAEDEDEALEIVERSFMKLPLKSAPVPRINMARKIKIAIYKAGSNLLLKLKNF